MAGIGFRLKRLLAEESYGGWLRAHLYGAVVSSGPWLFSICTLATLALLSGRVVADADQQLFRVVVVYTYTFSLVTTGGLQMVVTRHLADCLYLGNPAAFHSAYRWTIGATAFLHAALAAVFYGLAPDLPPLVRVEAVTLFVVVACTWMVMVFVGAAQDYASVVAAFFGGNLLSLAGALGGGALAGVSGYVGGFLLGQAVILFVLCARVEREFAGGATVAPRALLAAFRRYPALALGGLVYSAAITVDRLIFWASAEGWRVQSWFFASPYDTPLFLAYLSVVPSLAIFLVSVETTFYDQYRRYYGMVTRHGTLRQVLGAKRAMADSLGTSLWRLAVVQGPVTLVLVAAAPQLGRLAALEPLQVGILRAALLGAPLHILALFGTIILLYFDRRQAALEVSAVLLAGNAGLTLVSLALGPQFHGQGYALAALAACLWAYRRLEQTLADLEYLTFASQPMVPERREVA